LLVLCGQARLCPPRALLQINDDVALGLRASD
jgi:hypothetical protein